MNDGLGVMECSQSMKRLGMSIAHQTKLRMKGIPSKVHIIQTTMDLVHWLPIGTNLTDSNVLFQFDDANAGSFPARFYRLVIP